MSNQDQPGPPIPDEREAISLWVMEYFEEIVYALRRAHDSKPEERHMEALKSLQQMSFDQHFRYMVNTVLRDLKHL